MVKKKEDIYLMDEVISLGKFLGKKVKKEIKKIAKK